MITTITYKKFAERIQKFLANNWPDIANTITPNELYMYVFGSMAVMIETDANQKYQLEGVYPSQDGFVTTYAFAMSDLSFDYDSLEYALTLPFPPVNLPLGYSIKTPHFTGGGGPSFALIPVHAYQWGYQNQLPTPDFGGFYKVENSAMTIIAPNVDLINSGWTLKVPMLSPRSATGADTDIINMPDGALEQVFNMVVEKLLNRKQQPMTNVNAGVERYTERAQP
jgi:hypothetical protein